eukprot:scaffold188629_cov36-Tisochrysis_lutea.AAC.1
MVSKRPKRQVASLAGPTRTHGSRAGPEVVECSANVAFVRGKWCLAGSDGARSAVKPARLQRTAHLLDYLQVTPCRGIVPLLLCFTISIYLSQGGHSTVPRPLSSVA